MQGESRTGDMLAGDASMNPLRSGRYGELVTDASVGRFSNIVRQGKIFTASMQAGAAFGTALTATAVTFTLYNPSSSSVYLAVLQAWFQMSANQTTTTNAPIVVYAANVDTAAAIPATTTAITVRSALLGGSAGTGVVYSAATLPAAPIVVRVFPWGFACQNGGTVVQSGNPTQIDNVDGALVLKPNSCLTLQGIATSTAITGIAGMTWAELTI